MTWLLNYWYIVSSLDYHRLQFNHWTPCIWNSQISQAWFIWVFDVRWMAMLYKLDWTTLNCGESNFDVYRTQQTFWDSYLLMKQSVFSSGAFTSTVKWIKQLMALHIQSFLRCMESGSQDPWSFSIGLAEISNDD